MLKQSLLKSIQVPEISIENGFVYSSANDMEQLLYVRNGSIVYRHLFNGKDWVTELPDNKVSTASLCYLNRYNYFYWQDDNAKRIDATEESILETRNEQKKAIKKQKIIDYFSVINPITDDHTKFMRDDVLPNYIFYSQKDKEAYCSACHSDFDPKLIGKTRQGLNTVCPICGSKVKLKSKGKGHHIHDDGTATILQPFRNGIIIRIFSCSKSYIKDYRNPSFGYSEQVREVFDGKAGTFYEKWYDGWRKSNVQKCYDGTLESVIHYKPSWNNNNIYSTDWNELFKGTVYEHSNYDLFFDKILPRYRDDGNYYYFSPWKARWWFLKMLKQGNLQEYLLKVGFNSLAWHYWIEPTSSDIKLRFNPDGKRLNDMIRVTRQQYKQLLSMGDPKPFILSCMQSGINASNEEFLILEKHIAKVGEMHRYADLFKFSVAKFDKYISSSDEHIDVREYFDYLDTLNKLHRDLHNDFLVFPKHFRQAHDLATKEYNRELSNEKRARAIKEGKAYAKRASIFAEEYAFAFNGLQIVVPSNCGEIIDEGISLRHCVGTYVDRVRKGETLILFIRKTDDLSTPFYTMEVRDGRMTQCYGYRDCTMTDDIKQFVNQFCNTKKLVS